jgi:hypothetical protein
MSSDINQLLHPQLLPDLREDSPPVQVILWNGATRYETIVFEEELYPFDTLEQIKRMICHAKKGDPRYTPNFLFVGVPVGDRGYTDEEPSLDDMYVPMDFLWYPIGSNQVRDAFLLKHPVKTLSEPDYRFVGEDGSYSSPNYESRARTTMEQAFLKPREGQMPFLHVFPFHLLYAAYKGAKPISEMEWNKKFAPYFPDLASTGPFDPKSEDIQMGLEITKYIRHRQQTVDHINDIVKSASTFPSMYLTGIQQLTLLWKKPIRGFQGCAAWFYPFQVTKQRPYARLLPADGSGVTKLHVEGILPLPSLHDARIIEQWNKELSPTPKLDFCCIKYVHRPAIQSTPPIYGTIHVMNDGTMKLHIQPPKTVKKLSPEIDFRHVDQLFGSVFEGLPQPFEAFRIHELSTIFTLKVNLQSAKFTRKRLTQRLPTFQPFFREIAALPEESPILSLRYKSVSQYVSENDVFAFITQWSTKIMMEEGQAPPQALIEAIQNEFQFSRKDAVEQFTNWYKRKEKYVVEDPEEGEFSEEYHPGVDIHIHAQHPSYFIHVYRIDNEDTYRRIFTLLTILFMEEDEYFQGGQPLADRMEDQEQKWEQDRLKKDAVKEEQLGSYEADQKEPIVESIQEEEWLGVTNDPLADLDMNSGPKPIPAPIVEEKEQPPARPIIRKDERKRVQPKQWFIRKLEELDSQLFGFQPSMADKRGYSSMCQARSDRQPIILTKDQYQDMRARYENDAIYWIIYPLEGTEDPPSSRKDYETITIMRYGSDADHIHYMFCPKYYCIYDEIMVLEKDFVSDRDRDGQPKPKNSCPFCYGLLISKADTKKDILEGKTVMERLKKDGSNKIHGHIGFIDKTSHPDGLYLPCCFIKQSTLRIKDREFNHIRDQIKEIDIAEEVSEADGANEVDGAEVEEGVIYYEARMVEYATLFRSLFKKYILESNKFPDAGFFATASTPFDVFFHQDSSRQMVTRVAIQLRLRPTAHGFLRVGVDNTINESLLGVLAPLLNATSIIEVKERFEEVITPRVFLNAHFGNLVLEFFDPADQDHMPKTQHELMKWSEMNLGIRMTSSNSYALLRIFNAYYRFILFIHNPNQRKELRHIQPLLAEPGLFTINGLQLIVLEDKGDDSPIEVRCPIFGVSTERHKNNDFAFVSRRMRKIGTTEKEYAHYELYIYTMNKMAHGGEKEEHHLFTKWNPSDQAHWPEIVTERVKEYLNQCQSAYRSIYTPQRGIAYSTMMPLSSAVQGSGGLPPEGIIKDHYNHLVGVTFRSKPGSSMMVVVPIVDDGVITVSSSFAIKKIYLDWEDIRLAPVEDVIKFYKGRLKQMFSGYTGYEIKYVVKNARENQIVAIQLENGVYVPVGDSQKEEDLEKYGLEIISVESFESVMNKQMSGLHNRGYEDENSWEDWIQSAETEKGCGKDESLDVRLSVNQLDELYQQFRLMVSRWLTGQRVGSGMRKQIEEVLFRSDLPDYEKHKRLYFLLSSTFLSWLYPDENWEMPTLSLVRKDCRIIPTKDGCTGTCRWKDTESGGKCLLHIPSTVELDTEKKRSVDVAQLFTIRVLDELARFPSRRKQLLSKDGVSTVTRMIHPIRDGDQYIIPESSVTWLDLLRFDWLKDSSEEPRYFEEMSREKDEMNEDRETEDRLPEDWVEKYGRTEGLHIEWSNQPDTPFVPLMPFMGMSILDWGIDPATKSLTDTELKEFAKRTKRSVGYIEFTDEKYDDENKTIYIKRKTEQDHVVLFVKMGDKIGLVMQNDTTYLPIESLPEVIQREWSAVRITTFITKPQVAQLYTTSVPTVQPMMDDIKEKDPPLVVKKTFKGLRKPEVEEPVLGPVKIKKPLKKPEVEQPIPAPVLGPVPDAVSVSVPVPAPVKMKKPPTKPEVEQSTSAQLGGRRGLHILTLRK